jgi:hypothetical protein
MVKNAQGAFWELYFRERIPAVMAHASWIREKNLFRHAKCLPRTPTGTLSRSHDVHMPANRFPEDP